MISQECVVSKGRLDLDQLLSVVQAYKAKGLPQSRIAADTGYSDSWISKLNQEYGPILPTPRQLAAKSWPWQVRSEHQQCSPHKRMRDHSEYVASGGKGMAQYKLKRLRGFYNRLMETDTVLEYHPGIPPSEGINTGGWAFRPRLESDGDLMIRVNEVTHLSPVARLIYRIPDDLP